MRLSTVKPIFETDTLELLPTSRRVRTMLGGQTVADSKNAAMLFEKGHLPLYYLPRADVDMSLLSATEHRTHCPRKGDAVYWTVQAGGKEAENAVWGYPEPLAGAEPLADYVAFYWDKMDAWFEEDEPVHVHARNPYHRVDTRLSSRHIKVVHGGEVVAETERPTLLFETDVPTRYYLPTTDVRLDLLTPSDTVTHCPYKGNASYYSLEVGKNPQDLVWYYQTPLPEAFDVRDQLCFYSEKVDEFYVDGQRQS